MMVNGIYSLLTDLSILTANKHELFTYLPQGIWESQDFEKFAFLKRTVKKLKGHILLTIAKKMSF